MSNYTWVANDRSCSHPTENSSRLGNMCSKDGEVDQNFDQVSNTAQLSSETIIIKDSCDIEVTTTETQIAVSLQAALQVAIALVINLTIADSARAEMVTQDLLQKATITQASAQKLVIENSRNVNVKTTDTDVAVSLQLLIQILLALVVSIDIL
ncbi:spore coat protein [Metabacillus sp. KIGAM252]|uniref:Spore coat protein n=1 Tax=Metabacillus flavus TaxID=2823519 RepID=A0ABS5LCF0_9BACI|nr:spore coat protein [Metabacillus flavus]MBS2968416.1 spore coat protein [Metabacillus flavus]